MTIRNYKAGDVVYSKGEAPKSAFIVLSGEVDVGGKISENGAVLGVQNLAGQVVFSETAKAKTDASLQVISFDQLEKLSAESPPEIQKILNDLLHHSSAPVAPVALENDKITNLFEKLAERLGVGSEDTVASKPTPTNSQVFADLEEMEPIRRLLLDDNINDILINGCDNVFIEREGKLIRTDAGFTSDEQVYKLAECIVSLVGRKLDNRRPIMDTRLQDGSRVNIIAPPLAVDGTSISIRKFPSRRLTLDSMEQSKNISKNVSDFLKIVARCRINSVISGGTGSGKTTLLNAMIDHIDDTERLITIEDATELRPKQPDVVRLETRPAAIGAKPSEQVNIRDLVRNSLRMRPDRIIVGEVRGEEAFDMMQAMNTGHEGSLTTIHANHPRDALSRLENMVNMGNVNLPIKALRYQIASALQLIIQVSRMRDGHRRVTHISEVVGMEGDMITMHDLFTFVIDKEDDDGKLQGHFKWSGIMPRFIRRIAYYGEIKRLESALGVVLPKNF